VRLAPEVRAGHTVFDFNKPCGDGTLVVKHVVVGMQYEMWFVICFICSILLVKMWIVRTCVM